MFAVERVLRARVTKIEVGNESEPHYTLSLGPIPLIKSISDTKKGAIHHVSTDDELIDKRTERKEKQLHRRKQEKGRDSPTPPMSLCVDVPT